MSFCPVLDILTNMTYYINFITLIFQIKKSYFVMVYGSF